MGTPVYYDYGSNLYYQDGNVIYDGTVVATEDEYVQQAQAIVSSIPDVDAEKIELLPLGVFALTDGYGDVEDSTLFLQLAISKERIFNLTENEAGALLHFADGQTQQWTMVRLDEPQQRNP